MLILGMILLILHKTCCDPLSELSRRDGSDEGLQHMVSMTNKKKISSNTPSYLEVCKIPYNSENWDNYNDCLCIV